MRILDKIKSTPPARFGAESRMKGQTHFRVHTRLNRVAGTKGSYRLDAVKVLPSPKSGNVIVQATDGLQAVCVVAPGHAPGQSLVPSGVLPTRQSKNGVVVQRDGAGWRSGEGKQCDNTEPGDRFPSIAEVLPDLGNAGRAKGKPHVTLGIDLTLLNKLADSLGTSKLTLLIPTPNTPGDYINQPIAICPADDEAEVDGIGVLMPLKPEHKAGYYNKVRADVAKAESRCKVNGNTTSTVKRIQPK